MARIMNTLCIRSARPCRIKQWIWSRDLMGIQQQIPQLRIWTIHWQMQSWSLWLSQSAWLTMSTPMKIISLPWTIIAMPPNPLGKLSLDPLTKKVLLLDLPKRIMDSGGPFVHLNHGLEIWGTLCYVDSLVEVVGITPLFCGFNWIRKGAETYWLHNSDHDLVYFIANFATIWWIALWGGIIFRLRFLHPL